MDKPQSTIAASFLAASASTLLFLSACSNSVPPHASAIVTPPQIHLIGGIQNDIYGEALPVQRVGAGRLQAAVRLHNQRDHDLHVEYRYRFLNRTSIQVEQTSAWQGAQLPANGYADLEFTSMTPQAADFDLEVRPAK